MKYLPLLLIVLVLPIDALAQRMNESCWPQGVCIYEREQRRGRIDYMLENRSERDAWVLIEMTDLYNYRSTKRLPVTTLIRAGESTMAFRLTKSSPQEVSRKRRRSRLLWAPVPEPYCIDSVGCVTVEFEERDIVYRFFNRSAVARDVEITINELEALKLPKKGLRKTVLAGEDEVIGKVRIKDVWGSWNYGYRVSANPAS
ncbi:MAG: hypothetical protein JJ896_06550 [Rhodothermales bacterium]|nr:hypothetical protein [Rhodothermales bacterium]MBO6779295.1 hypothetical protein [Rhodothermales bacterium]